MLREGIEDEGREAMRLGLRVCRDPFDTYFGLLVLVWLSLEDLLNTYPNITMRSHFPFRVLTVSGKVKRASIGAALVLLAAAAAVPRGPLSLWFAGGAVAATGEFGRRKQWGNASCQMSLAVLSLSCAFEGSTFFFGVVGLLATCVLLLSYLSRMSLHSLHSNTVVFKPPKFTVLRPSYILECALPR